jgi:hypothetical protein
MEEHKKSSGFSAPLLFAGILSLFCAFDSALIMQVVAYLFEDKSLSEGWLGFILTLVILGILTLCFLYFLRKIRKEEYGIVFTIATPCILLVMECFLINYFFGWKNHLYFFADSFSIVTAMVALTAIAVVNIDIDIFINFGKKKEIFAPDIIDHELD